MIIDFEKTEKYILFLLEQIENNKEDWWLNDVETQEILNEVINLKKLVEVSPLVPGKVKEAILTLKLYKSFENSKKSQYLKLLLFRHATDAVIQSERKKAIDMLEQDLKNIYRLIQAEK